MSAYLVLNSTVINRSAYKQYVYAVVPTLEAHNAEILVADYEAEPIEGNPGHVSVVIRFKDKDTLNAWYQSDDYQAILGLRLDNTEGSAVIASEFNLERNLEILEGY